MCPLIATPWITVSRENQSDEEETARLGSNRVAAGNPESTPTFSEYKATIRD